MVAVETIRLEKGAYRTAVQLVKAQGNYNQIGSGCYGAVYGDPKSDMVYKIGRVYENKAYLEMIKLSASLETPDPHLPKVFGIRIYKVKAPKQSTFVIAMERLTRLRTSAQYSVFNKLEDMLRYKRNVRGVPQSMKETAKRLRALKKAAKAGWDIHDENVMVRNGKDLVITDPFTDIYDNYSFEL